MQTWSGTREASEQLGITLRTLYRLIDRGELPAYKMGRVIRLKTQDVEEYRRQHGGPGGLAGDREPRPPTPFSARRVDGTRPTSMILVFAVLGMLVWAGSALIIDAWMRPRRPSLSERLAPFQRTWVADEVEEWMRQK